MVTNNYQSCIDTCNKCAQECYECYEACLNEPDLNARRSCVKILIECANMCEMASGLMSINSRFAKDHCKMCATVCDTCTTLCNMFKDDHCQKCADICSICANECRSMVSM